MGAGSTAMTKGVILFNLKTAVFHLALGIPADSPITQVCLKTSRVLSEFSKAQVNSVPANGSSRETEVPRLQALLPLPGLDTSTPLHLEEPAEPRHAQASPGTGDGDHKREPLAQAPGLPGWPQPGPAQAVLSGSASGQQPPRPVRDATRAASQESGPQKAPEDDGPWLGLAVPSPTSPVSGIS